LGGGFSSQNLDRISTLWNLPSKKGRSDHQKRCRHVNGPLYSGDGVATSYTWHEEAFEIDVTVKVPKDTQAKDIYFKAQTNSIDLRIKQQQGSSIEERCLLDPCRHLRGKVALDGTFWVISDPDRTNFGKDVEPYREVTVTIEKQVRTPVDDFDVIDYDWNGVYKDDEAEVSYRRYDQPEELNVREYAASLGVDIDNLDMRLVDKSMFSSGLNVTKSSLDSLQRAGLMKEITQQEDGSEWITNDDGERVPFSSFGKFVSNDESRSAATIGTTRDDKKSPMKTIPFLDTDSPWHRAVPVKQSATGSTEDASATTKAQSTASSPSSKRKSDLADKKVKLQNQALKDAIDPISTLTVARLREILKERGLKVSGNKKELQERLRAEVQSMMMSNQNDESTSDDI
jgi:hypothetical protein